MALLFADSFDHYATADLMQKWTQSAAAPTFAPTITASVGRRSTQAVRWTNTNAALHGKTLLKSGFAPGDNVFICGFAFTHSGVGFTGLDTGTNDDPNHTGSQTSPGLLYIRKLGVTHIWFRLNTTGTVSAYLSTGLLGTTSQVLSVGVWTYIEVKVLLHASAGSIEIRFNGVDVLNLPSLDTQNGGTVGWDEFGIGHLGPETDTTFTWDYDDLYVCDGAGGVNDDFLGDVAIDVLLPTSAGTYSDGVPSTGANEYAVVDEALMNGDTDYNTISAVNDDDSFNFPNAPVAGAAIRGVQACIQATLPSGGSAGLKATTRLSSTDYAGAESAVGGAYSVHRTIWDVRPSDSAAWTDSDINAAEFGYQKSS